MGKCRIGFFRRGIWNSNLNVDLTFNSMFLKVSRDSVRIGTPLIVQHSNLARRDVTAGITNDSDNNSEQARDINVLPYWRRFSLNMFYSKRFLKWFFINIDQKILKCLRVVNGPTSSGPNSARTQKSKPEIGPKPKTNLKPKSCPKKPES